MPKRLVASRWNRNVARMRECIKYQDELIHVIIIVRKSDDCRIAAIEGRLKMLDPQ